MNGFGMGLGWLIPVLFIVGLVYFLNDNNRKNDRDNDREKSAKEILDLRLAKGEIDKEEYEERVKALKS
jgi:putative membrane protein